MSKLIDAISAELEKYRPIEETAVEPKVEPKVEPEHLTEAKECSTRQSKIDKLNAENKKNLSHTDVTSNPLSFNNEEVEQIDEASIKLFLGMYQVWHKGKKVGSYNSRTDAQDHARSLKEEVEQIEELSINTLASYKKKAGVEASNLDKASASIAAHGNHEWAKKYTDLANKRVSGIIKATKKQFKEEVQMKSFKEFNEIFADQGSGSDAKDNAEWEKRRNAAVKKKNDSIKKASTDKAMDQAIKDEMKEEFEQIDEAPVNFSDNSPSHTKAKELTNRPGSSSRAVYHPDGSATIHTKGSDKFSSANVVDNIHKNADLGFNRSPSDYNKRTHKKGGLTYKTTQTKKGYVHPNSGVPYETRGGNHEIHISHATNEEFEQIHEITSNSDILKMALARHTDHVATATKSGDHERVKVHQKMIGNIQKKLGMIARISAANEEVELDETWSKDQLAAIHSMHAKMSKSVGIDPAKKYGTIITKKKSSADKVMDKAIKDEMQEEVELEESVNHSPFIKKYKENEDDNQHSKNVVHLARHFGSDEDKTEAHSILTAHNKTGHLTSEVSKRRDTLHKKLWSPVIDRAYNKSTNEEVEQIEETDVPWHDHSKYEVKFKKPKNPNRTGMDAARSLAQRAMATAKAKKTVKEELELDEGNDQYSVHATHPTSGVTRSVRSVRDPKESPNEMKERVQRDLKSQGFKVTHITKLGVQATDDNDSEPVEKGKKGAGRPSGSLSGARDRSKNGVRSSTGGLPTYALHLPNKNK